MVEMEAYGTKSGSQDVKGRFSVSQVKGDILQEERALSQVCGVCCWNVRLVVKGGGGAKGGEVGEVV